jgi:hypothetical protein
VRKSAASRNDSDNVCNDEVMKVGGGGGGGSGGAIGSDYDDDDDDDESEVVAVPAMVCVQRHYFIICEIISIKLYVRGMHTCMGFFGC